MQKAIARVLHSDKELDEALHEVDRLWEAIPGTEDHDRLELLMVLVEDYENRHYPIGPPDPIEAIKFRMEQQGLNRKKLANLLGTRGRVSEILNGKRGLSLSMIRALSTQLHIPAEVLIQPIKTVSK